jgi:hypothetical protein
MGITAIPNEVFAITGIKLKLRSPFDTTMNIELANGSEGYIPPPEQHRLGGYTTWPARTAGLEVQAEPRIVAGVLALLAQLAGKPLRSFPVHRGPYAQSILASKPYAYWQLDDIEGLIAIDSSGNGRNANHEGGVALYLPGMPSGGLSTGKSTSRAVHLAGGWLSASLAGVGESFSIELWFWNGLPTAIRPITGHLLSFEATTGAPGVSVGITGTNSAPGRLFCSNGAVSTEALIGAAEIRPKTWHHLVLVRDRGQVVIYLDGRTEPEITGKATVNSTRKLKSLFIGGNANGRANFEGKIDEVTVFDRALGASEIARHFAASRTSEAKLPGS